MNDASALRQDRNWAAVQALTGLIFMLFVAVHLANTLLGIGGASAYDAFQELARRVYQHPVVEITLVLLVLPLHILAGISRARLRRRGITHNASTPQRFHRIAGWFLVIFIFGHIAAVRLPSLLYDVYPRFEGVAFSIAWIPAYFYPYYLLLGLAGLYHATMGTRRWVRDSH